MGPILRKAEISDAAVLSALATKTFTDTYADFNTAENMRDYIAKYFSVSSIEQEIKDPDITILLAFIDHVPAGYIKLVDAPYPQNTALAAIEISRYYVDAHFQGHGVGRALMEGAYHHARTSEKTHIWLGVWQKNQKAIEIYKHQGFIVDGVTVFVLGDDPQEDYLMLKVL